MLGRVDTPTGKHDRRGDLPARGETRNGKIIPRQGLAAHDEPCRRPERDIDDRVETLPVAAVARRRLEPDLFEADFEPVGRFRQPGCADTTAGARIVGKPLNVGQIPIGRAIGSDLRATDPSCNKDIRIAGCALISIGGKRKRLAVGREHGEPVEARCIGNAFQPRTIDVDGPEIELPAARIVVVGREQHSFSVGEEERREVRTTEVGDLARLGTVGVGDPELQFARAHQALVEELPVILKFVPDRPGSPPDDLGAIPREERAAVVAGSLGQALDVGAVRLHPVEFEIAVPRGSENNRAVRRADGRFSVVGRRVGQRNEVGAVGRGAVDLVTIVDRPDVAL